MEAKKLKRYEKDNCGKFDVNFTVSGVDRELLNKLIPQIRIEIIPNGVDTDFFINDSAPSESRKMVMVGGMNWYPNRDAAIYMCDKIWPLLKNEFPNIFLTVVGASPPKRLIEVAEQDENIEVTGFVDDVRPYLGSAGIYLCPMRDGGGTRLKILDALSSGKAIISTTIGCEGIDVTPGKNVLIADTPQQFLQAVGKVINNPVLRMSLGNEGRKLAESKYSWMVIGKKLASIYSEHYNQC